jgi:hypothetical protein
MSATNPLIVQLSDGTAVYAGPTSAQLPAALGAGGGLKVDGSGTALPVSGTVTVGTLPAGSISAGATGTAGTPSAAVVSVQGVASGTVLPVSDGGGSLTVDGTVAVSGTSTVQGPGTSGTPSGGVLTVQGQAAMTPLLVDGSATTQPVSGTVTANIGTAGTLATESTLSTVNGKLPSTVAADRTTAGAPAAVRLSDGTGFIGAAAAPVRTDPTGTTTQPVSDAGGSLTVDGTVGVSGTVTVDGSGVTQPVSGTVTANAGTGTFAVSAASLPLPSGAAASAKQPALGTAGTASADVITVQGAASMTPIAVSGTVTATPDPGATVVGTSSTISCDTTAVVVDDTSVANTTSRTAALCNPSANTASIYATGSGGTGGWEVLPGSCYSLLLAASSTPLYCYAASTVSATAQETK